ncbi:RDD family protein [Kribbella sp. CA-253562]|uniref:RDD family protein n=1 Tax=Kribbella sp. CA-253562 TaxID=3239942 RepID=UPI003D8F3499
MTAQDLVPAIPCTPDGVPLAGWWRRAAAELLDLLIVFVVGLPLTGYFWYRWLEDDGSGSSLFSEPWSVYRWWLATAVIGLVVDTIYRYFFLVRTGATPGKRALGISIRLRDVPGPPPPSAVVKRLGLVAVFTVVGALPGLIALVAMVGVLDVLWPLWDGKRQAWHDKVAGTNVVRGPATPVNQSIW